MAASLIIGIDPGATGAIAFLSSGGDLLAVEDVPVDKVKVGTGHRSRVSIQRLLAVLRGATGGFVYIEQPTFRPMKKRNPKTGQMVDQQMGVAGAGAFGENYGCLITACVASGCVLNEVRPGVWSRAIGLHGGKDDARRMAANQFPSQARLFARVMDHNRAEAALCALYGLRQMTGTGREST